MFALFLSFICFIAFHTLFGILVLACGTCGVVGSWFWFSGSYYFQPMELSVPMLIHYFKKVSFRNLFFFFNLRRGGPGGMWKIILFIWGVLFALYRSSNKVSLNTAKNCFGAVVFVANAFCTIGWLILFSSNIIAFISMAEFVILRSSKKGFSEGKNRQQHHTVCYTSKDAGRRWSIEMEEVLSREFICMI